MIQKTRRILEAAFVKAVYYSFKAMPIGVSSNIGSALLRKIGPLLRVNKLAEKNIRNALPELDDLQVQNALNAMWDNLGRVAGEFPNIGSVTGKAFDEIVEVEGVEHIEAAARSDKATIFFSAHLSNWELLPKIMSERGYKDVSLVYRKANNPYVDKLIIKTRNKYASLSIPKGSVGARHLINEIKKGGKILMLVDQKQNDGISVPFFHKEAMTAPAIATLALKYGCALNPIQVIRLKGAKFKIKALPPLELKKTDSNRLDILNIMTKINSILESFIRENPGQWFWVHNRWPKE
jgi:KDO2-lipid IV(A) lauroyltransferase